MNKKLEIQNRIVWAPLNYLLASSRITCYYPYQYIASNFPKINNVLVTGRDYSFTYRKDDIVIVMDKYLPSGKTENESLWLFQYLSFLKGKVYAIIYFYVPEENHNLGSLEDLVDMVVVFNSFTEEYLEQIETDVPVIKLFEPHNASLYYETLSIPKDTTPKVTIGFHGWEYPVPMLSKVLFEVQQSFNVDYLFITNENYTKESFPDEIVIRHVPWRLETFDYNMSQVDIGFRPRKPDFLHKSSWSPLEWLKYKKPVIIDGKMKEYIRDFPEGWIAPQSDNDWYNAFKQLINNSDSRKYLGEIGYEYLKNNYSIEKFVEELFFNISKHILNQRE